MLALQLADCVFPGHADDRGLVQLSWTWHKPPEPGWQELCSWTQAVLAREVSQLPGPLILATLSLKWDLHKEGYMGTVFLDDTCFRSKCPSLPSVSGRVGVFLNL